MLSGNAFDQTLQALKQYANTYFLFANDTQKSIQLVLKKYSAAYIKQHRNSLACTVEYLVYQLKNEILLEKFYTDSELKNLFDSIKKNTAVDIYDYYKSEFTFTNNIVECTSWLQAFNKKVFDLDAPEKIISNLIMEIIQEAKKENSIAFKEISEKTLFDIMIKGIQHTDEDGSLKIFHSSLLLRHYQLALLIFCHLNKLAIPKWQDQGNHPDTYRFSALLLNLEGAIDNHYLEKSALILDIVSGMAQYTFMLNKFLIKEPNLNYPASFYLYLISIHEQLHDAKNILSTYAQKFSADFRMVFVETFNKMLPLEKSLTHTFILNILTEHPHILLDNQWYYDETRNQLSLENESGKKRQITLLQGVILLMIGDVHKAKSKLKGTQTNYKYLKWISLFIEKLPICANAMIYAKQLNNLFAANDVISGYTNNVYKPIFLKMNQLNNISPAENIACDKTSDSIAKLKNYRFYATQWNKSNEKTHFLKSIELLQTWISRSAPYDGNNYAVHTALSFYMNKDNILFKETVLSRNLHLLMCHLGQNFQFDAIHPDSELLTVLMVIQEKTHIDLLEFFSHNRIEFKINPNVITYTRWIDAALYGSITLPAPPSIMQFIRDELHSSEEKSFLPELFYFNNYYEKDVFSALLNFSDDFNFNDEELESLLSNTLKNSCYFNIALYAFCRLNKLQYRTLDFKTNNFFPYSNDINIFIQKITDDERAGFKPSITSNSIVPLTKRIKKKASDCRSPSTYQPYSTLEGYLYLQLKKLSHLFVDWNTVDTQIHECLGNILDKELFSQVEGGINKQVTDELIQTKKLDLINTKWYLIDVAKEIFQFTFVKDHIISMSPVQGIMTLCIFAIRKLVPDANNAVQLMSKLKLRLDLLNDLVKYDASCVKVLDSLGVNTIFYAKMLDKIISEKNLISETWPETYKKLLIAHYNHRLTGLMTFLSTSKNENYAANPYYLPQELLKIILGLAVDVTTKEIMIEEAESIEKIKMINSKL